MRKWGDTSSAFLVEIILVWYFEQIFVQVCILLFPGLVTSSPISLIASSREARSRARLHLATLWAPLVWERWRQDLTRPTDSQFPASSVQTLSPGYSFWLLFHLPSPAWIKKVFLNAQETFIKIFCSLDHKTNLSKFKRLQVIQSTFSNHSRNELEINNKDIWKISKYLETK